MYTFLREQFLRVPHVGSILKLAAGSRIKEDVCRLHIGDGNDSGIPAEKHLFINSRINNCIFEAGGFLVVPRAKKSQCHSNSKISCNVALEVSCWPLFFPNLKSNDLKQRLIYASKAAGNRRILSASLP